MRKISLWLAIAAIITGLFLAFSCTTAPRTTNLKIQVANPIGAKMILPSGDIDFDHYVVTIQKGSGAPMAQTVTAPPPPEGVTFANIESGDYAITVSGFNAAPLNELLGHGTNTVTVLANDTSTAIVQVNYETGNGDVAVTYTLTPADLVYEPAIVAELWNQTTWSACSITGGAGTWAYNASLPAGFYAHRFELHSMGNTDILIAGGMEAIFVMSGRTSTGGYGFNATNITPPSTGSSVVIIFEPQDMPFNVVFTDGLSNVDAGEPFTLVASADIPVDTYYWFKNGVEIPSEHNATLTRNAPETERYDNFSVLAQAGGALASAQKIITSIIPPPEWASITWTVPAVPVAWPGELSNHPISVTVLDTNGDPVVNGSVVYWRISATNQDFRNECSVLATSTTTNGVAGNVFHIRSGFDGLGYVEVAKDAGFTILLTSSPRIGVGNFQ
jgi:hypothetical protein